MATDSLRHADEPDFSPEPGWKPIRMPFREGPGTTFLGENPESDSLRMHMFVRESDTRLFTKIWFGRGAEGPPGHAHGGSMAAVLDHAMGIASWVAGHPVVAATITVNFHRKLPLGIVAVAESWVEAVQGKKVTAAGKLYFEDPERPYSTSTGLFIKQPMESFSDLMAQEKRRREGEPG